MTMIDIETRIETVRGMIREKLRIRAKTLEGQTRKAGRLIPRSIRRNINELLEAQALAQHPKLSRMLDHAALDDAQTRITAFLDGIDPAERRKDKILSLLGVIAFNLLLIGALIVTWMWWTGRV